MQETTNQSIADIARRLRDESTLLFRQEVTLAKVELQEKAARVGRNVGQLGAGAFVAYTGLILLLFAAAAGLEVVLVVLGLAGATAHWLAPLIIGALVALIGYGMVQKAMTTLKHESLAPEKTIESLKEDKEWLQRKAT